MLSHLAEPFAFDFMKRALLAVVLAALNCSVIGVYVVLRRMSFISGALAHTILPGAVFAAMRGFHLFWGALASAFVTAAGIGWLSQRREIHEDTAIGVMLSGMFALGILLMSLQQNFRDFAGVLFGNILGVTDTGLALIAGATALVFLVLLLLHKELKLTSFDPDYAGQIGASPQLLRYVLLALTALGVVSAIEVAGALLTTALVITPAATALMLFDRLSRVMAASAGIAIASGIAGLYLSYYFDIASGSAIVLVLTAIFIIIWLITGAIRRVQATTPAPGPDPTAQASSGAPSTNT